MSPSEIAAIAAGYVAQNFVVRHAIWKELDEKRFKVEVAKLDAFFAIPGGSGITRGHVWGTMEAKDRRRKGRSLWQMQPQLVFQVKTHAHARLGRLHRAYVSEMNQPDAPTSYFYDLWFSDDGKIIAESTWCPSCAGHGCASCKGGSRPLRGEIVGPPGDVVDVHKIVAPTYGADRADYARDEA